MGIGVGLDVARSSLAVASEQISIVSRNVARIDDPNATRKVARVVTGPGSQVHIARVDRAYDSLMLEKYLSSNSSATTQTTILNALTQLSQTIGDADTGRSPANLIAQLGGALQQYATNPQNAAVGASVVSSAKDLAYALNEATLAVNSVRQQADADIANSVADINTLLKQFGELNAQIVQGSRGGGDLTDLMDARDGVLKQLSAELGIRTISRTDNDIAIFTDSGVTLFDKVPRTVTFGATSMLQAGGTGNAVYADGVPIAGAQHVMAVGSGRLAGLVAVRDEIAPAYQKQLDEIARGLIEAFAEYDQSASPTLPAAAGLFTYNGGPSIPTTGVLISGLAGQIKVNPNVDPSAGGNPVLIRDGAISGNPAYAYNASGAASFTDRIQDLISQIDATRSFDVSAQVGASGSLSSVSKDSVAWLEELRQSAKSEADYRSTVSQRAGASLQKETGISLDEEMTNMLSLERTFQASSRIIKTIDDMLASLLAITG